ncbi:hypothetical protein Tco_1182553 [Tanacetum coccineum]
MCSIIKILVFDTWQQIYRGFVEEQVTVTGLMVMLMRVLKVKNGTEADVLNEDNDYNCLGTFLLPKVLTLSSNETTCYVGFISFWLVNFKAVDLKVKSNVSTAMIFISTATLLSLYCSKFKLRAIKVCVLIISQMAYNIWRFSQETVHTATTGDSAVSAPVTTVGVAISTVEPKTPPTTAATAFIDEDLTIA